MRFRTVFSVYALGSFVYFGWLYNHDCAMWEVGEQLTYKEHCEYSMKENKDKFCMEKGTTTIKQHAQPEAATCSFFLAASWPLSGAFKFSSWMFSDKFSLPRFRIDLGAD
jgi:hypothetical protein